MVCFLNKVIRKNSFYFFFYIVNDVEGHEVYSWELGIEEDFFAPLVYLWIA